jgi:hypothetical protein
MKKMNFKAIINKSINNLFPDFHLFLFISHGKIPFSNHLTISPGIFNFSLRILLIINDASYYKTGNFAKTIDYEYRINRLWKNGS